MIGRRNKEKEVANPYGSKESSSKAIVVNETSKEESDNDESDEEDDELSLITGKIKRIWKNKNPSRFNNSSKRPFYKKEKILVIFYECKKLRHFKSKCPDLEKSQDKKKKLFNKAESVLDASLDDKDYQPDDTVDSDGEEVIFKSREDLIKGYNQLLSASTRISKAYRKLNIHFQHLERDHEDLKKTHQVHLVDFVLKNTSLGNVQDTYVCEEVNALLDEKVSSRPKTLLKDFQDLEERMKSLTEALEDLEDERKEILTQKILLQKECTLANNELDKLKKKNSNLWMECQLYKKISSNLK
ncbi:hypothetical protein HKD37_09G025451 [Glycine soja]